MADGSERLKFFLDLIDKVSGPASRVAKSMRGVETSMKAVEKAEAKAGSTSRMGRLFAGMSSSVSGVAKKLQELGPGAARAWGGLSTFAGGLWDVTKAGLAVGAVGVGIAAAGASYAIEAASFKRNMVSSFELMLGSKEEAARVYKMIDAFADDTPFEARDVFSTFKSLKGSGLDVDTAKKTMAGIFDIASLVDPSRQQNAISSITLGIAKIQGEGKLTGEAFNMITEATDGFAGKGVVLDELATRLKVTKDQASAMISKGLVPAKVALEAYLGAISKGTGQKNGALGGAMAKFGSGSFEGQVATLKSRLSSLFEDINIQPVIDALSKMNDGLKAGTPAGDALRAAFNALGDDAGKKLAAIFTPQNIAKFVQTLADLVPLIVDLAKAFGTGTWDTFVATIKPIGEVFGGMNAGAGTSIDRFRMLGQAIGAIMGVLAYVAVIVGAIAIGFVKIGQAILWVVDQFAAFVAWWHNTVAAVVGLGVAIVDGIFSGITQAWPNLKTKWNALVGQLPEAVASKLRIASPSRVMAQLGMYTVQGFTKGILSMAPANQNALGAAVAAPAPAPMAAIAGAGAAMAAASGGGSRSININITPAVTAAPGVTPAQAEAQGMAYGNGVRRSLADVVEQLAREAA